MIQSKKKTQGAVFGEVTMYGSDSTVFRNPLFWLQLIIFIWYIIWIIIFIFQSQYEDSKIDLWGALLGYILGVALFVIGAQGLFLWRYHKNNDIIYRYRSQDNKNNGKQSVSTSSYKYHYMSHAHSRKIVNAAIATILTSLFTLFSWWNWLCEFKDACYYTNDIPLYPNPFDINEIITFNNIWLIAICTHALCLYPLIEVLHVHTRPLISLNHLITGIPNNHMYIVDGQHGPEIHYQ